MSRSRLLRIAGLTAFLGFAAAAVPTNASPINPEVHRKAFEDAKKGAEVVAEVRVLAAVCTKVVKEGDQVRAVTLQLALQVLGSEKGPVKKNEIVVVSHDVTLPAGPGPRSYGYMAAIRRFPFTPGVKGGVALRWDKDSRSYTPIAGWVPEPNDAEIPKEVGKSIAMKDEE